MNYSRVKIRNQRQINQRIIVHGTLVLDTPTCLGSGDRDSDIDLKLLRDSLEDRSLLMGSSITGGLRNYLKDYQNGYDVSEKSLLFGGQRSDDDGDQSPLIVNDALSNKLIQVELRDGVKIHHVTRTAEAKAKYDLEFLEAGTEFDISFELLGEDNLEQLVKELVIVLKGLEKGAILIGMKKHRGFGRCHVTEWKVWKFDLRNFDERLAWLNFKHWQPGYLLNHPSHKSIEEALNLFLDEKEDKRDRLTIHATFTLASPLLIRSGQASSDKAPDIVHIKSRRDGELKPILSGTALAGALRHRSERIVKTINRNSSNYGIVEDMFGSNLNNNRDQKAEASRLIVHESVIEEVTDLIQNRIAIDRFTGGALDGVLFNEQPVFGSDNTKISLEIELRKPQDKEIGLLLLLLKDLWTGDLSVGGASNIGRGRLKGKKANINLRRGSENMTYSISQSAQDEFLSVNDSESLEKFVAILYEELTK